MTIGPSPLHIRLHGLAPMLPHHLITPLARLLANPHTSPDLLLLTAEVLEDGAAEAMFREHEKGRAAGLQALAKELRATVPTMEIHR